MTSFGFETVINHFLRLGVSRKNYQKSLSSNGENIKQLLGHQPLLTGFQENFNATSKRSQQNPKQLLKHHRPHMPQLTTLFRIQQNEGVWAKTVTMGEFKDESHSQPNTHKRMAHRMFVKILKCVD